MVLFSTWLLTKQGLTVGGWGENWGASWLIRKSAKAAECDLRSGYVFKWFQSATLSPVKRGEHRETAIEWGGRGAVEGSHVVPRLPGKGPQLGSSKCFLPPEKGLSDGRPVHC